MGFLGRLFHIDPHSKQISYAELKRRHNQEEKQKKNNAIAKREKERKKVDDATKKTPLN
jgi:hypothetical protein